MKIGWGRQVSIGGLTSSGLLFLWDIITQEHLKESCSFLCHSSDQLSDIFGLVFHQQQICQTVRVRECPVRDGETDAKASVNSRAGGCASLPIIF